MTGSKLSINFDAAPAPYEILGGGTIVSGEGVNGSRCLKKYAGSASIRVELPMLATVNLISMATMASRYAYFWDIRLRDRDNDLLHHYHGFNHPGSWVTRSQTDLNVSGVASITFEVHATSTPLGAGTAWLDNCVVDYVPDAYPALTSVHDGGGSCPISFVGNDQAEGPNPLSLRLGEKRLSKTDLALTTPAGTLAFTRTYRQSKLADYHLLGQGWTHNHALTLTFLAGTPNTLEVRLPNGGITHFIEESPDHFVAAPGATSTVDWDGVTSQYTLTAADFSTYTFNANGQLISRTWPSGETWTYTYTSGQLSQINDGYGRLLVFRYYTSGDHAGQLWRVGDHSFDDTDPLIPTGRYVEYGYQLAKMVASHGAIVNAATSLLHSVQDVRGAEWTYTYYGQAPGETDIRQLNFLIQRHSPGVDTTGDGAADGPLSLETVNYTMQGSELAVNGGMESDSDWTAIPGAEPLTNAQSTSQVDSGAFSRQVITDAAAEGIEGEPFALVAAQTYIITARVYPVSGSVHMSVSGAPALAQTSAGTGAWETLRAVYTPTSASTGHRLQFTAVGGAAEFFVDSVSILESDLQVASLVQQRGAAALTTTYTFQAGGQHVTTEESAGRTTTHHFQGGLYAGPQDPSGNLIRQGYTTTLRPVDNTDANGQTTTLWWDSTGQHLDYVSDPLGHGTGFTYDTQDRLTASLDAEGRETQYTYGDANNPRLPTLIKVIDNDQSTVLRWQSFTYDTQGRLLSEQLLDPATGQTVLQETTRSYYSAGDGAGLLETVTQQYPGNTSLNRTTTYFYDPCGRVVQVNQNSTFGACTTSRTVYDQAGNVVANICNYNPGASSAPTTAAEAAALYDASRPDENHVTTHEYDSLGRRVATTTLAGSSFAQTSLTVYDALDRVVRTIQHYVSDPEITNPYTAAHTAFDHGSDNTRNLVSDTAYNARGLVQRQTDPLGNVTLLGYDAADRVVKTVQLASQSTYDCSYATGDPALANYVASAAADEDLITTQAYDANGNLVQATDPLGRVTFTVYDALNRPVKVVRSAKAAATLALEPGDTGYDAVHDPRAAGYVPTDAPDQDLITSTEYDALGRVVRTTDPLGHVTLYGYDPLGRQIKTVRNAATPTYNVASDPDLSAYPAGSAADQDLITTTVYNDQGQATVSQDPLDILTRYAYDGFGRPTDTVQNYAGTGFDPDPAHWAWVTDHWEDGSSETIPHGDQDQNQLARTVYDAEGRVQKTQDVLNRWTLYGYDSLNRQVKVIRNAATPAYDQVSDPDLSGYTASSASAMDRITTTTYDARGRVAQTTDPLGNATRFHYDVLGRQVMQVANYYADGVIDPDLTAWTWSETNQRWEDGNGIPLPHGAANDRNLVSTTAYDLAGRVSATRASAGQLSQRLYDAAGRTVQTIAGYIDGVYDPAQPDVDLISTTTYDKAGQVLQSVDARGTATAFTYDEAGRRQTVTRAAGTALASTDWTCYDKGGRVLRVIRNCRYDAAADPYSPAERDAQGAWLYAPVDHGALADRDLVTSYTLDALGRPVTVSDPVGNATQTAYDKAGQVVQRTNPAGQVTFQVYDKLRRLRRVIQNYVSVGEDPALWVWDAAVSRWETSAGLAINHGVDQDQNIVVDVALDLVGRRTALTDPRGQVTGYSYDPLNRRTSLTNPLSQTWSTAYSDLASGTGSRVTLTDPLGQATQRDSDRLGRLTALAYLNESPKLTPDVALAYDLASNRVRMTETDGAGPVRETSYSYDAARRLVAVGFDTDGDGTLDDTVSYAYDAGGLRTTLTLPGNLSVTYTYDARGQLVGLTDWDDQPVRYAYDQAGRLVLIDRAAAFQSRYRYDAAGRLRELQHRRGSQVLGHFAYDVDALGNRVSATEALPQPGSGTTTLASDDPAVDYYRGTWSASGDLWVSQEVSAALRLVFFGRSATLTLGVGPDYSICDVYVNGMLWRGFDNYAASAGEDAISLTLQGDGPHILEVKNRAEKSRSSSGYKVAFKQLVVEREYDLHTIQYGYDGLSRLQSADYFAGDNVDGTASRQYGYTYDLAGNRTQEVVTVSGTPTTTNYTYNAANQITNTGFVYDAAGRMTSDGTNTYVWDKANRLLSMGGIAYAYDGLGNRLSQTANTIVTAYLNDVQPGLTKVLAQTMGSDMTRFVHGPRGIQAMEDSVGAWTFPVQDGLGSVRDNALSYSPYGIPNDVITGFAFTGEMRDANGLQYHRARYYAPELGVWASLDPFEGMIQQALSMNGYSWVEGNPINAVDPRGMILETFGQWDDCEKTRDSGCTPQPRLFEWDQTPLIFPEFLPNPPYLSGEDDTSKAYQTLRSISASLCRSPSYAELIGLYVVEEVMDVIYSSYYDASASEEARAACGSSRGLPCVGVAAVPPSSGQHTSHARFRDIITETVARQFWGACKGTRLIYDGNSFIPVPCRVSELARFTSHNVQWRSSAIPERRAEIVMANFERGRRGRGNDLKTIVEGVLVPISEWRGGPGPRVPSTWGNYTEDVLSGRTIGYEANQILAINYEPAPEGCPWVLLTLQQRAELGIANCTTG